ncbi:haloacid dehalogenase-like hydrolase [Serratia ureilytica]
MSDKQQQPAAEGRRVVFFDLDGTCIRRICSAVSCAFAAPFAAEPAAGDTGAAADRPGAAAAGARRALADEPAAVGDYLRAPEAKLKALERQFIEAFRQKVTAFPVVQMRLRQYLDEHDAEVWLITGSPERLVEQVYRDSAFLPRVRLIGSRITAAAVGFDSALPGAQKVVQLEQRLGAPLKLYSGYSDSKQDNPLLFFASTAGG